MSGKVDTAVNHNGISHWIICKITKLISFSRVCMALVSVDSSVTKEIGDAFRVPSHVLMLNCTQSLTSSHCYKDFGAFWNPLLTGGFFIIHFVTAPRFTFFIFFQFFGHVNLLLIHHVFDQRSAHSSCFTVSDILHLLRIFQFVPFNQVTSLGKHIEFGLFQYSFHFARVFHLILLIWWYNPRTSSKHHDIGIGDF
uniref:ORF76 n=1 Tax=Malaco herpesvirus 1 TaxID=3031797 RepID=A0AA48P846_9VIRU|nr:TPA_asm: ORF76 [Malaco herpesvirus 1]